MEFLKESVSKPIEGENGFVAFFNKKLDINRFFIASGTGDNMPKVEFGNQEEGQDEDKDLFEDSLEDALCVFKSGGGKDQDLLQQNESLIMFYVDLENELIVDKD